MIGVTMFGIFLTPVFYVLLRALTGNRPLTQHGHTAVAEPIGAAQHQPAPSTAEPPL
jgi:multidrug efflux pump